MELHVAIKNLAKYQGVDFLTGNTFLNALADFNAYEQHTALKGIMRIIVLDGYVVKISKCTAWDMSAQKLVTEIVQTYAMNESLVTYAMQSVAYAIGFLASEPQLSQNQESQQPTKQPTNPNSQNPAKINWKRMSVDERERYLNSLVEIRPSNCGIKFDSIYIADDTFEKDVYFYINYEVSGKLKKDQYVNLCYAIYDKSNRLRKQSILTSTLSAPFKGMIDNCYIGINFKVSDIKKILLYIEE